MTNWVQPAIVTIANLLRDGDAAAVAVMTDGGLSVGDLRRTLSDAASAGVAIGPPRHPVLMSERPGPPLTQQANAIIGQSADGGTVLRIDVTVNEVGRRIFESTVNALSIGPPSDSDQEEPGAAPVAPQRQSGPPPAVPEADWERAEGSAPVRFEQPVREIVQRIAQGDVAGLRRDGVYKRDGDLLLWARRYGGSGVTIVPMPSDGWAAVEGERIDVGERPRWVLYVPVWTLEVGKSDLTLIMEVSDDRGRPAVSILDLYAM